ncbi:hypothetical protein TNCV_3120201 [Trichonephila clavipes]|uniref:Uncharacterized protein n=1 Tax=Trichonephila clavipes TaxID=2585209 RepID=A0A8X6W9P1_TRICX|nr:hypothetical protein TNCV_3120201 [Trichonephila clavipes]
MDSIVSIIIQISDRFSCDFLGSWVACGVTASDSRPEGLGSMHDDTKYSPSTHGVSARQISGSECLAGCCSRNHGCKGWRIFPSPRVSCLNCGGGVRWCRQLSYRSPTCLRLWRLSILPFEKD